jgi:hypothetical protein
MPPFIPLRFVTGLVGLMLGYYAGMVIEGRSKAHMGIKQMYNTLASTYGVSSVIVELIEDDSDSDDNANLIIDFTLSDTSDDDTDYSE